MDLIERNRIPYDKLNITKDMLSYVSKAGASLRRKNSRKKNGLKCKRKDAKPRLEIYDYCYYTGIRFVDAEQEYVNPNDPRKRTLDHKKPLALCFIDGWTIDEANHPDNLCYCLRVVNNVRSSTTLDSFIPIRNCYREKLIEGGYDYIDPIFME